MTALRIDGAVVARYRDGADVAPVLSPRPYLEAWTRGGVAVTEVGPDDHVHHLGLSTAIPDVSRSSFWGGRTFVRGTGSTLLDNHGVQRVVAHEAVEDGVDETLAWHGADGRALITEERAIRVEGMAGGWRLRWVSRLVAAADGVEFGSPQTNGREGAFYGGVFWRTPFGDADVFSADGGGTDVVHGSRSPWLAVSTPAASLVAVTRGGMPWFVRTGGYAGFGPAVAVEERRVLAAGEELVLDLEVVVRDGPVDPVRAARIAAQAGVAVA
ncbi:DUF6807 domain-containing protein [Microbacterium sp. NPDC055683]